jgi:hypothetical protein
VEGAATPRGGQGHPVRNALAGAGHDNHRTREEDEEDDEEDDGPGAYDMTDLLSAIGRGPVSGMHIIGY